MELLYHILPYSCKKKKKPPEISGGFNSLFKSVSGVGKQSDVTSTLDSFGQLALMSSANTILRGRILPLSEMYLRSFAASL